LNNINPKNNECIAYPVKEEKLFQNRDMLDLIIPL